MWKFETGVVAMVIAIAVFFSALEKSGLRIGDEPDRLAHTHFTSTDYALFGRNAVNKLCPVYLRGKTKTCFRPSPLEKQLTVGRLLPDNVPERAPPLSLLLKLSSKADHLRTFQYGQTVILVHRETGQIEDILHLSQTSFAEAQALRDPNAPFGDLRTTHTVQ